MHIETKMSVIAKKLKLATYALYHIFKGKTPSFSKVLKKELLAFRSELLIEVSKAKTPQEKLTAYVSTRIQYLRKLSDYYATFTVEYLEHYLFVEKARKNFTKFEIDTIAGILIDGQKKGVFQIENIALTSEMIVVAMKGLEVPLIMQEETKDIKVTTQHMLRILFKGIESR